MDTIANEENESSYRPVVTITNDERTEGGTIRIHESIYYHHMVSMEEANKLYKINPNIKKTDVVVWWVLLENY